MKKEVIIDINAFAGNEEETIIVTTDGFLRETAKTTLFPILRAES